MVVYWKWDLANNEHSINFRIMPILVKYGWPYSACFLFQVRFVANNWTVWPFWLISTLMYYLIIVIHDLTNHDLHVYWHCFFFVRRHGISYTCCMKNAISARFYQMNSAVASSSEKQLVGGDPVVWKQSVFMGARSGGAKNNNKNYSL